MVAECQSVTYRYREFPVPGIFSLFCGIGIGIEKNWYRKKSRYRYRKNLVPEKSIGIGFGKFGIRKKVSVKILVSSFSDPDGRNGLDPDDRYGSDHPDDVRFSVFAVGACAECVILEGEHKWIPGATESHIGKNKILPFCKSLPQTDF